MTGVLDSQTGEIFFGINLLRGQKASAILHWLLKGRLADYVKDPARIKALSAGEPGTHSEIVALDQALKAREALLGREVTEAELHEFWFHNRSLWSNPKRRGNIPPRCANCAVITDEIREITR